MEQDLKTGTTTVGLIAKDSVILAADMRASMGHLAYDEESKKLYKITEEIGVTNAGAVGDSLTIVRFMRSQARLYEIERETKITPNAMAALLSNVLNANRHYPFAVQFVLGGINKGPELYELTPYGGVLKRDKYAVSGSGTELALATLDQGYRTGMSEEEGIELAVQAIEAGKKRDIYSGGKAVAVMVIDRNGIRELEKESVKKIAQKGQK
ncbi:MAG: proteasome subunit beta [Candidatus Diapherotrites archaeon]|uniref:Proteasome subunit beta n=1 Tax=Candidatus Iainarchaeum sp. TaxID=3101447 RepID=A0A938YMI3_9ARCH|nr:proteasome subunit beta [Candidatus Diapherotrites archaeon]